MRPPAPRPAPIGAWIVSASVGLAIAWRMPGDLLLSVDLVAGPEIPWPSGLSLDGPELPRRTPFWIPLAALSRVVAGPTVIAGLVIAMVAAVGAGASRFAPDRRGGPEVVAVLAAGSPFLTTRIVAGHLPLVAAFAVAVWLGHRLVWPSPGRWWVLVAFGMCGSSGALLGLALFGIGWLLESPIPRRRVDPALVLATQLPWLLPGAIVAARIGLRGGDGRPFVSELDGVLGLPRLLAGGGFFLADVDLARDASIATALLGMILLAVVVADGAAGRGDRRHLVGALGLLAAVSTALPVVGDAIAGGVGWGPLGVLREPQKFVALWLVASLWSLERLTSAIPSTGRRWRSLLVPGGAVLAAAMLIPAAGGADGRLVGRSLPSWDLASGAIEPGDVVLALPWERYGRYDVVDGRSALGPVPWLVDASEIRASGDAGLGLGTSERLTPDPQRHAALGRDHRLGRPIGSRARALGVDVVVVFSDRIQPAAALLEDPDLTPVVVEEDYAVYLVDPGG